MTFRIAPQIAAALAERRAVVALESTVVTHGLPHPQNLELALALERVASEAGAIPATIGIIDGEAVIGLTEDELERLASGGAEKASLWNLAALLGGRKDAGTTVAATLHLAAAAGIDVFATGGIGGVHRDPTDVSADLVVLARHPLLTVCAGPKSVLDVPATLERLESLGVAVAAYRSDRLAGFHVPLTPYPAPARCDSPEEAAGLLLRHRALGLQTGVLLTKPVSEGLDPQQLGEWLARAEREASASGLRGKEITPFLLARLAELSDGRTVEVNVRLLHENAELAARIAVELAAAAREGTEPGTVGQRAGQLGATHG